MKHFSITLFLIFTFHLSAETILLKGGLVHAGNGSSAKIQDILITGNIISGVGQNLTIAGNTRVIELNGLQI